MIDILLLVVLAAVTWCVASEGAWGAASVCLCVLFAGLLAMNLFEPVANYLGNTISSSPSWQMRWDVISLVGLFAIFVAMFRAGAEYLAPGFITVHPLVYEGVRWSAGLLTGYVTMAFLLTALHTAPLPREFIGFTPERSNFFGISAPDRQWLGFTQYVSETALSRGDGRIFDGPTWELGDEGGLKRVWPSFPIRYASRRGVASSGQSGAPQKTTGEGGGGPTTIQKQPTTKSGKGF